MLQQASGDDKRFAATQEDLDCCRIGLGEPVVLLLNSQLHQKFVSGSDLSSGLYNAYLRTTGWGRCGGGRHDYPNDRGYGHVI